MSHIDPEREQFDAFKELPRDTPINMINLIKLKKNASYPDGTETTGFEAYKSYSKESGPVFARVGGTILWRGQPETVLIGPSDESWDLAFIARYPNSAAFMEMVTDPQYREAVKHRQAGVETSRLIRCADMPDSKEFG